MWLALHVEPAEEGSHHPISGQVSATCGKASYLSEKEQRQQDRAGDRGGVEGEAKHVQLLREHLQQPLAAVVFTGVAGQACSASPRAPAATGMCTDAGHGMITANNGSTTSSTSATWQITMALLARAAGCVHVRQLHACQLSDTAVQAQPATCQTGPAATAGQEVCAQRGRWPSGQPSTLLQEGLQQPLKWLAGGDQAAGRTRTCSGLSSSTCTSARVGVSENGCASIVQTAKSLKLQWSADPDAEPFSPQGSSARSAFLHFAVAPCQGISLRQHEAQQPSLWPSPTVARQTMAQPPAAALRNTA